jgi:hypothetical protein
VSVTKKTSWTLKLLPGGYVSTATQNEDGTFNLLLSGRISGASVTACARESMVEWRDLLDAVLRDTEPSPAGALFRGKPYYEPRVGDIVAWHGLRDPSLSKWIISDPIQCSGNRRLVSVRTFEGSSGALERDELAFVRIATAEERRKAGIP